MRRLPTWLAGGPEVSDLAYRIVVRALDAPRDVDTTGISAGDVVDHIAEALDVDEGDVLRAFAELQAAGVLEVRR